MAGYPLRAITIDAAWILRQENEIGLIRAGKRAADFAVLAEDPSFVGAESLRDITPSMPAPSFELSPYFDHGATFLWALSGALLGARKGYAIPGILTVAFVSSGGGANPGLSAPADQHGGCDWAWCLCGGGDDSGSGGGLSLPGVVLVGLVNAVGGGILRDVLIRREPNMFLPGTLEEVLALLGCLWFVLQVSALGWPLRAAAWLTIGTIFVLRLAAIRYGLRSKPLPAFRDYWEQPHKR